MHAKSRGTTQRGGSATSFITSTTTEFCYWAHEFSCGRGLLVSIMTLWLSVLRERLLLVLGLLTEHVADTIMWRLLLLWGRPVRVLDKIWLRLQEEAATRGVVLVVVLVVVVVFVVFHMIFLVVDVSRDTKQSSNEEEEKEEVGFWRHPELDSK